MCSYMAMFPPTIPHVFIRWLTEPGDVVYDPFSGRGTAPFEASLLGRVGMGSDANPLAVVLTGAKVDPPERRQLVERLAKLEESMEPLDIRTQPEHIRMLFSGQTLGELLWLRDALKLNKRVDRFLMAALLGVMHGNLTKAGKPTGLTVPMPNTFSMSPGYVAGYIRDKGLKPPDQSVIPFLRSRVERLPLPGDGFQRGRVWSQDVRQVINGAVTKGKAKLIFTSPPYMRVVKYGQYNWVRLWMLGVEPRPLDQTLFTTQSLNRYIGFMHTSLSNIRRTLRDDGYLCLMVGDVRNKTTELNLASELESLVQKLDLQLLGTVNDQIPVQHKVSRIWGETKGNATRTDRILVLAGPSAPVPGRPPKIDWN